MDEARLRASLGQPVLSRVVDRLVKKMRQVNQVSGRIVIRDPSEEEIQAYDRLLGISKGMRNTLVVSLPALDECLRHAQICTSLEEALICLRGPLIDPARERRRESERRRALFTRAEARDPRPGIALWLAQLERYGILKRMSADWAQAEQLMDQVLAMLAQIPAKNMLLKELAATVTGDAHGLDEDRPLYTLLLGAVAALTGKERPEDARARRALFRSVGLFPDSISGSVLVYHLNAQPNGLAGQTLNLHARAGQPCRLTLAQLRATPLSLFPHELVYVCENPAVIQAALLKGNCKHPLVCTDGQPSGAVSWLLTALAENGSVLAYHGDFDWPGIRMANGLRGRLQTIPWRMDLIDYQTASASLPLSGDPVVPAWSPALGKAMQERGFAVHEEAVLANLLADLASPD